MIFGSLTLESAMAAPPPKVTICHNTHSATNPQVTITVSVRAIPAHMMHGDLIGECNVPEPPVCGDGNLDADEACDDGNTVNNDGCSDSCFVEACGDGVQQASETCDDGNTVNNDGCSEFCQVESFCGDGTIDSGERCDSGGLNGLPGFCNSDCTGFIGSG